MHKETRLAAAVAGMLLAQGAQAALYTSSDLPFDLTLNTGPYTWVNNTATLGSTRTNDSGTENVGPELVSVSGPFVETVVPQIGVPGSVKVYTEETTRTYDRDFTLNEESLEIDYDDAISGANYSPSSYQISGTISRQAGTETDAALTFDFLSFDLGLGVDFGAAPPPAGLDGHITFQIGDSLGNWNYAFSSALDSASDSVLLSNSHAVDFSEDISFVATYSVMGLSGVEYDVTSVALNLSAGNSDLSYGSEYNEVFNTDENVLSMTEIPALEPVPLPAAAWLFISALGSLVVMRRNGGQSGTERPPFRHDALLP